MIYEYDNTIADISKVPVSDCGQRLLNPGWTFESLDLSTHPPAKHLAFGLPAKGSPSSDSPFSNNNSNFQ